MDDLYRQSRRVAWSALSFILAVATLLAYALHPLVNWWQTALVGCLALGSVLAFGRYARVSYLVNVESHHQTEGHDFTEDMVDLKQRVEDAEGSVGPEGFYEFYQFVAEPREICERITESIESFSRSTGVSTTLTFRLSPRKKATRRLIPVALVRRGLLQDGLKVTGPGGERLSTLTRGSAAARSAAWVRQALRLAGPLVLDEYQDKPPPDGDSEQAPSLEEEVLYLLCANKPTAVSDVEDLTDRIWALPAEPRFRLLLGLVCDVIRILAAQYPLMVEYEQPSTRDVRGAFEDRVRITVHRRAIANLVRERTRNGRLRMSSLRDDARQVLGVPPAVVSWPLTNAHRAASYHLEIRGPEGTYLARQNIRTYPTGEDFKLDGVRYAMRQRFGQRHSHLYVRGLGDNLAGAYFENSFFERVPGSVGAAAMSALAAAVLVTIAALSQLGVSGAPQSDLVAAILAFPAVAGAWAGFDRSGSLGQQTLVARICTLATVSISLIASAAYVLLGRNEAVGAAGPVNTRDHALIWIVLSGAAIINVLAAMGSWTLRSLTQRAFYMRGGTTHEQ